MFPASDYSVQFRDALLVARATEANARAALPPTTKRLTFLFFVEVNLRPAVYILPLLMRVNERETSKAVRTF
jgi:hypothetical protein